jgi:hypothetical protein
LPRVWGNMMLILGSLGLGRALFMFLKATMGLRWIEAPQAASVLGTSLTSWAGTIVSVLVRSSIRSSGAITCTRLGLLSFYSSDQNS